MKLPNHWSFLPQSTAQQHKLALLCTISTPTPALSSYLRSLYNRPSAFRCFIIMVRPQPRVYLDLQLIKYILQGWLARRRLDYSRIQIIPGKHEDVSAVFDKPGQWKDLHGDRKSSKQGQVLIETRKIKKVYEARVRVAGYGLLVENVSLRDIGDGAPSGADIVAFFEQYDF